MKERDAEIDAYAIDFVNTRKDILRRFVNLPWLDIRLEYDGMYREIWIWVLLADFEGARDAYEFLINELRVLDINTERCEINLILMYWLQDGKMAHVADLCGKRDVEDFNYRQLRESDVTISGPSEPNVFSTSSDD